MGNPLDFIVFGTPRSGTTAMGRYLSATDSIYCFLEILKPFDNHEGITAPDSFLRYFGNWSNNRHDPQRPSPMHEEIARRKDEIRFYGHKRPSYYLNLQRVVDQSGCGKAFLCYRDIRSVADSYSSRAQDPSDDWHPGRVGMIAALDAMFLAHALANLRGLDVLVVPQSALARDWETTLESAVRFLDPDVAFSVDRAAAEKIGKMKARANSRPAPTHTPVDLNLLKRVEDAGLDECLNKDAPFRLDDVRQELRAVSERMPKKLMTLAAKSAARHPSDEVRDYVERWRNIARRGWRTLKHDIADAEATV